MIKPNKHYQLDYYSNEWGKRLYICFETDELEKIKEFIKRRRITQYNLNLVNIELHHVELGV